MPPVSGSNYPRPQALKRSVWLKLLGRIVAVDEGDHERAVREHDRHFGEIVNVVWNDGHRVVERFSRIAGPRNPRTITPDAIVGSNAAMRREIYPSGVRGTAEIHGHHRMVVRGSEPDGMVVPASPAIARAKDHETARALPGEFRRRRNHRSDRLPIRRADRPRVGATSHREVMALPILPTIRRNERRAHLIFERVWKPRGGTTHDRDREPMILVAGI